MCFFFSSRRRHTRSLRDWSSDVCSSDLGGTGRAVRRSPRARARGPAQGPVGPRDPRVGARRPRRLHRGRAAHRRPHRGHPQGVRPVRRLGQHFLTDPGILRRIVAALDPAPDDLVLEIGAGTGTLTGVVAPRVRHVVAIEKDRRLVAGMRDAGYGMGESGRVTVVEGDSLRLNWHALVSEATHPASRFAHPAFKVLGNIPYNITSPLIDKALTPPLPERIVFLVQAEVADRVAAAPGSKPYGALSVGVQAVCRVERLFIVRAGAFRPPPRVTSALVRFTPRREPVVAPDELAAFRAFVTACFTRRRKQLRNALMAATGRSAETVLTGLATLGFDRAARPESLTPGDFARLLRWSVRL